MVALAVCPTPARADFFTQIFTYACGSAIPDPPPAPGFLRWSSPSTWGKIRWGGKLPPGSIPGKGAGAGVNVTIPCGAAVLLDIPQLNLLYLDVRGFLKVEDPPRPRLYRVSASFISVEGVLAIGTPKQHFRSKVIFTLLPNPRRRLPLDVSGMAYPDKTNRRKAVPVIANVGHKAFAVVGGRVRFHGLPGGRSTPSWVRLSATAMEGTHVIQVDKDVAGLWPVGAFIALSSTDYYPQYTDKAKILAVRSLRNGNSRIVLDRDLKYRHNGVNVSDLMGGSVDERAEVALLSRNIVITGLVEGRLYRLEGGHFIVHQSEGPQMIEGVEFWRLGQQGTLGRYNIHFHVCGDDRGRSSVYKNSIHDSNQRCVVVHATHNLTVEGTVAYNTSGHCFLVEEGGEQDNTFLHNLGFLTRRVEKVISFQESDAKPSTFWISNLKNHYIGNVAGGSYSAGFWTELRGGVRGMSVFIPELSAIQPLRFGPAGTVVGNVIHSNARIGFQAYPHGIRIVDTGYDDPPGTAGAPAAQILPRVNYTLRETLFYKHAGPAIFLQASGAVIISHCTFADCNNGLTIQSNSKGVVEYSRFVGYTSNVGTPPSLYSCNKPFGPRVCAPIKGCKFPPTDPKNVRSLGIVSWQIPMFAILISPISYLLQTTPMPQIVGNTFSGYDPTCRPAAGVATGLWLKGDWWDCATAVQGVKVAGNTPAVWLPPPFYRENVTAEKWSNTEAMSRDLALRDTTGDITGGGGGYVLANDTFLLPPFRRNAEGVPCRALPHSNAWACPGTCYRSVRIKYVEPGFFPYPANFKKGDPVKKEGDYSYLVLTRASDGLQRVSQGNLQISKTMGGPDKVRFFYFSLLAGEVYTVQVVPGRVNRSFWPEKLQVGFVDGWGSDKPCPGLLNLRFLARGNTRQWVPVSDTGVFWSKCPGLRYPRHTGPWPVMYAYTCFNTMRVLLLRLNPSFPTGSHVVLNSTAQKVQPCRGTLARCGVVPGEDWYYFYERGGDVPGFQRVTYRGRNWRYGKAVIGAYQYNGPALGSLSKSGGFSPTDSILRQAFFFRRAFAVSRQNCYMGLVVEFYPIHGLVVYLNGAEAFRFSMPPGPINSSVWATNASAYVPYASLQSSPVIPLGKPVGKATRPKVPALRTGVNILAWRMHVHGRRDWSWYFDSTVSLTYRC